MSHFYTASGEARHFVRGKNGQMRPSTMRDAKLNGWFPGVTDVLRIWPSGNLKHWIEEQLIVAAMTTPRNGDADDEWKARVRAAAQEESEKARSVGQRRHDILHEFHKNAKIDTTSPDFRFVEPYFAWLREHVSKIEDAEFIVVNRELGYAGTVDVLVTLKIGCQAIIDVKNRKSPKTYQTDLLQLVAYQKAIGRDVQMISIVLGTEKPELYEQLWVGTELAWKRFLLCFELWKESEEYNPTLSTSSANNLASLPF